jgi:uncharacterized membrane protein YkvA (DUF1232 family)
MNRANTLSPEQTAVFERLCEADQPTREELKELIPQHLNELLNAGDKDELLPVDLAESLARNLEALLGDTTLGESDQKLILGAARFFVSNEDTYPDLGEVLGLNDDLVVYNYVVATIGKNERQIND